MNYTTSALNKLVLGFILFISLNSISQQQNYAIQCTLDHRAIMAQQSFSEDAPEAETARDVIRDIMNTMNEFYVSVNSGENQAALAKRTEILLLIQSANNLNLNTSMLNADIEFIQQYPNQ